MAKLCQIVSLNYCQRKSNIPERFTYIYIHCLKRDSVLLLGLGHMYLGRRPLCRLDMSEAYSKPCQTSKMEQFRYKFHSFRILWKTISPLFEERFCKTPESGLLVKNNYHKVKQSFHELNIGQSCLLFIGSALRNKMPQKIERTTSLRTLKYNLKKSNLDEIGK